MSFFDFARAYVVERESAHRLELDFHSAAAEAHTASEESARADDEARAAQKDVFAASDELESAKEEDAVAGKLVEAANPSWIESLFDIVKGLFLALIPGTECAGISDSQAAKREISRALNSWSLSAPDVAIGASAGSSSYGYELDADREASEACNDLAWETIPITKVFKTIGKLGSGVAKLVARGGEAAKDARKLTSDAKRTSEEKLARSQKRVSVAEERVRIAQPAVIHATENKIRADRKLEVAKRRAEGASARRDKLRAQATSKLIQISSSLRGLWPPISLAVWSFSVLK